MTNSHLVRRVVNPLLVLVAATVAGGCRGKVEGPDRGSSAALGGTNEGNLCDSAQPGFGTRPLWSELGAVPNYEKVSENFNAQKTVLLLSSAMNKAVTRIGKVRSELEKVRATGNCDCKGTEDQCDEVGEPCDALLHPVVTRQDCQAACQALADAGTCGATGEEEGWQLDDLYYGPRNVARKAIEHVKFLDGIVDFITGSGFGNALAAAGGVANGLADVSQFLQSLGNVVDQFTEGFHLGAYSQDRPDLWYCVPRAGSGVYAPMANLANGKFSIGASYTSGLAAKKVHGVFSMGAATVEANGKSYPFLPGVAYNVEIDGWKMFDKNNLFGIEGIGAASGSLPVGALNKADIFNLVDNGAISELAGPDGQLSWHDLLVKGYFPADYVSHVDQQAYAWPRTGDDFDTERTSKAVFGAGLDMKLEMKKKEFDLPAIPIGGFASVKPFFTVEAGVAWHNKHDKLKKRIEDSLHIAPTVFSRDRHAMQAADSSRDVGVSGHVTPAVGAELNLGLKLARFIEMGIFARIALKLGIEPGTYGDTMDTSSALTKYLATINPPVNLPCDPIIQTTQALTCTNPKHSCASGSTTDCTSRGRCRVKTQLQEDVTEGDCEGRKGTWSPYMCAPVTSSEITGWQGPGCNPLSPNGTGYIGLSPLEQDKLNAQLAAQTAPNHSIFTYALSDLVFKALLDASAMVELRLKIFKWKKTFTLFKWSDVWNLGSTNKTWFQEGLEAQYEDDCSGPGGVINHQPSKVKRYPSATSSQWAQYDQSDELVHSWCYPTIATDASYADYQVPTNQGIVDTIKHITDMGHEVGEQMWGSNQLCVGGENLFSWLADSRKQSLTGQTCIYTLPDGTMTHGPCEDAFQVIAQSLGCIDAVGAPAGAPLTADHHFVDLGSLFGANATEIDEAQLLPAYQTPALKPLYGAWIAHVEACLDATHAEDVQMTTQCAGPNGTVVACKPERCCGDGILSDFEACDPSVASASQNCTADCQLIVCGDGKKQGAEQCDDGNTKSNDGCSSACRLEKKKPTTTAGTSLDGDDGTGEPDHTVSSSVVTAARGDGTADFTGGACEAATALFSELEVASLTLELELACGTHPESKHCEDVARLKATSVVERASNAGASGCWAPEHAIVSTAVSGSGDLVVVHGNAGFDLVYRFKEREFAVFWMAGGSVGIAAKLGATGAYTLTFGEEFTYQEDIIQSWSGQFNSWEGSVAWPWLAKLLSLQKSLGIELHLGYFQGASSKGPYFSISKSFDSSAIRKFLQGATLPVDTTVTVMNWWPWDWLTEVLHLGFTSGWGNVVISNSTGSPHPYLQFDSKIEYVAHMFRNIITIPAGLAYGAWLTCGY